MPETFRFVTWVITDTPEHAELVMAERLGHDDPYRDDEGREFDYAVDWRRRVGFVDETAESAPGAGVSLLEVAIGHFRDLHLDVWLDIASHLTCTEAVALDDLLLALGLTDHANELMRWHAASDDEDDEHYDQSNEDDRAVHAAHKC